MNAIQYLREEHDNAREHFRQFEQTKETNYGERKRHVEQAILATRRNVTAEEDVLFPALRGKLSPEKEAAVIHLKEEHQIAGDMMDRIEHMTPQSETYEHMVMQLRDTLEQHFTEEETNVFPEVEKTLSSELDRLGDQMQSMGRSRAA